MDKKIIDGNKISKKIYNEIKKEVTSLKEKYKKVPTLSVILVGDYAPSKIYVTIKRRRSEECGMNFHLYKFDDSISEKKLINLIKKLNRDKKISGIIVQLPLPKKFNTERILSFISPDKDVDGLHPINVGKLVLNEDTFLPCTPAGIMELLHSTKYKIEGKNAVIIGRSNIVGKPIAHLLLKENATVTITHSKTKNLEKIVKNSDIVIAAVGKPEFIKGSWIKKDSIVIDVGINRIPDKKSEKGYKIVGDVDFKNAYKKAKFITPVPGGVGPMTVAMLLKNTLKAFKGIYKIPMEEK